MNRQWLLLLTVLLVTALFSLKRDLKAKRRCVATVTVILTLFSGLRTWWMGDLIKYYTQYLACNAETWKAAVFGKSANIGLRAFFRVAGYLGASYELCLFMIAAFSAITLGIIIYRYSTSPLLSYLMYIAMGFLIFTYSGLKQTVAMGFLCLAMIGVMEGKWKKFLILTAIGGLFHAPAFIFLLAYPFSRKRVDRYYFLFLIAAFAVVFYFRSQFAEQLTEIYYDEEDTLQATKEIGGRFIMMLFILGVALVLRPLRYEDKLYCYVFNIMVLASLTQLFSVFSNNYTRLADYFYQFVVLFVPMFLIPEGVLPERSEALVLPQRTMHGVFYQIAFVSVLAFAVWFYSTQVNTDFLKSFYFFWEVDANSLYGT